MPSTTKAALPYPASTDSPNGPLQLQNLALALDLVVLPRFTSITQRNTAFPTPAQGDQCNVAGIIHTYSGGAWRWMKAGVVSGTSDASGYLTFAHGMGATPLGAVVSGGYQSTTPLNNIAGFSLYNMDVNNLVVYCKRHDTSAALTSNPVAVMWIAFT